MPMGITCIVMGKRSRAVAKLLGMGSTQAELATALDVRQSTISRVLRGERGAGVRLRSAARDVYGIPWEAWDKPSVGRK